MKWIICIAVFISSAASAQNTRLLENQKDAWSISYTYVGEVKNGKPNGLGIAKYSTGTAIRYVGNFVDGMYNGQGTMLFTNGAFLTGNWTNGKLNGKGTNLTSDGALYIGEFSNGIKSGNGLMIFKDNSFNKGSFLNDKLGGGRVINLWTNGKTISEVEYADDKRNGMGFQYETSSKKLWEGEWKDDKWVQAGTTGFNSFLKRTNLFSETTDDQVLLGVTDADRYLKGMGYYYNLKKNKRYFGSFEKGKLVDGIVIGDTSRFIGALDDSGAKGYGYDFKFKHHYREGNFVLDQLNGNILDIDMAKRTVFYGTAVMGKYTGKAAFFNDKGNAFIGDYYNGDFTGEGLRLEGNGKAIAGTWKNGVLQKARSVVTKDGTVIPGKPKTFAEALNIVVRSYPGFFDDISGDISLDYSELYEDLDATQSLMSFPGSTGKDDILQDYDENTFFVTSFIETEDQSKARAKYNEIIKQLQACTISNSLVRKAVKLKGTPVAVNFSEKKTVTKFDLPTDNSSYEKFHIWLELVKDEDDNYLVLLKAGERQEEE